MKFIFNLARRELRASWRRLLFFFLCIGVGVGSIVALRSMIQSLNRAVAGEARALMTADVQAETTREWTAEALAKIESVARPTLVEARTETIEAPTMLRPADAAHEGALMVEVKGVERGFPLYGDFRLEDGRPFDFALVEGGGAVVAPLLLERLGLRVGDRVKIGERELEIRGVTKQEPGSSGGFRLGPRVFVSHADLESAGLTGFGSRARRKILFKVREGRMDELVRSLRAELGNNVINVRSYRDSEENLGEQFSRAENYLSLTGLVILVLGGIGVSSVTRVFVEQKKKTIAVLKCVGATGRRLTAAYLAQVVVLGAAGSVLGVVLAKVALLFVRSRFSESLPPNLSYELQPGAVAQGLGLGLLISVLFSALPLLRIRHIRPNMLLREITEDAPRRWLDLWRVVVACGVLAGLVFLASWQAGSLLVGVIFLGGLGVTALVLYAAAWLLIFLMRRARGLGTFAVRQAINSMHRPGNQTRVIVLAVGLGAFLVMSVQSLQSSLLDEFDVARRGNLPNMYLIDVQKDQVEGVRELVSQTMGARADLIPTVRARIAAVNGQEVDLDAAGVRRERGRLGREYVVTYRPRLEYNETIVAGKFWDESPSVEPEVSIEEGMRGAAGLDLGGNVTFDIQGRKLTARVTSIRRVDWRNSRTGFLILFRPGSLEGAPQTFVGAVDGPTTEPERSRFQRAIVDRFPNVSVIDVADIVRSVGRILSNITLAVSFIGGFVFLSGALILVGSIAMTKFQRVYEAAVLKTLGARRRMLLTMMLVEYGLLGLVAGVVGAAAANGLSFTVARYVFEIEWAFAPGLNAAGIAATILLVGAVGALSSLDVLTRKPLSILRAQ
ncbi:MAG: putative transport system permease protein [Acidobacteriota bacterium]|jgi:putative ABC transport system permease protein|nr:putative transport system permease protein [Acidobacteriota bacterium]